MLENIIIACICLGFPLLYYIVARQETKRAQRREEILKHFDDLKRSDAHKLNVETRWNG